MIDSTWGIALLLVAAGIAAATDMMRFKVYNMLVVPLAVAGVVSHSLVAGWAGVVTSVSGILLALVLLLFPYAFGMLGAGDVKFVAALGACLGPRPLVVLILLGALATGLFAAIIVVRRGGWKAVFVDLRLTITRLVKLIRGLLQEDELEPVQTVVNHPDRRHRLVPFSAMMTLALVAVLLLRHLPHIFPLNPF